MVEYISKQQDVEADRCKKKASTPCMAFLRNCRCEGWVEQIGVIHNIE
jgi:hypothetical protein